MKLTKLQRRANEATPGFTLIEMMVAVSIFVVVAMITTGALVTISDVNRKAQAIKLAMDNVSFALDSMSRNISDGRVLHCITGTDLPDTWNISFNAINPCDGSFGQGIALAFQSISKEKIGDPNNYLRIIYRFVKRVGNDPGKIQIWQAYDGETGSFVDITSSEVDIEDMKFYVFKPADTDLRVLMTIRGLVKGKFDTKFNLQSTISSRE